MKVAYGSYSNIPPPKSLANYTGIESVSTTSLAVERSTTFPLVNLHVSAKNLTDVDIVTVSDPMCVLFIYNENKWSEFSRTEVIWNNLNPEWVTFFTIMYIFEIKQPLLFRVFDVDKDSTDLSRQKIIGEAQIDLATIISSETCTQLDLTLPSTRGSQGKLFITPEQVENCASVVNFRITGSKLKKMKILGSNEPFFVVAKAAENGRYLPIFQSEVSKKAEWKKATVPYQILCNVDPDRPLRITVFDYRSHTAAVPIGHLDTSFARLSESINETLPLNDQKNKNVGYLNIREISLQQRFSFYDYIHKGVQLNLITAIDFTASNKDPRNPTSLHYLAPAGNCLNQYQCCIHAVGEILCPYDSDQLFPVLGFGAKINGSIQHCFPLTFNPQAPCVQGLMGIMGAYQNALMQVQLSGPTLFAPIIRYSSQLAVQSFQESRTYTILLIITDGIINDMQDTIDSIVDAGRLPLSIIIVGVGNADFGAMDVLDADDDPLVSRSGVKQCRDLVQFVPFNKYANRHYSVLASEVLDEIPRQLVEWAEMNGVRPN